jgi:hypothetical protein
MSNLLVQNIKHTNGTTAQTIDSSGRVLNPIKPAFLAVYNNNAWSTGSNGTVVPFDDVSSNDCFDLQSNFVTGTNRFVVPVAGMYYFYYHCYTHNSDATSTFKFRKNGSDLEGPGQQGFTVQSGEDAGTDSTATDIIVIKLDVDDYVQVFFGAQGDLYGYLSRFGGYLIG